MAARIVNSGDKFNRLIAVRFHSKSERGVASWLFRCDCGTEKVMRTDRVCGGYSKSCGCQVGGSLDLTGQKFDRLTVTGHVKGTTRPRKCYVTCTCGTSKTVSVTSLRAGKAKSCGCLARERSPGAKPIDVKGQRFGSLIAETVTHDNGRRKWVCVCDCGGSRTVAAADLRAGSVISCGCLPRLRVPLAGQRFGKLLVVQDKGKIDPSGGWLRECLCDCGNTCFQSQSRLVNYHVRCCGCSGSRMSRPAIFYVIATKRFVGYGVTSNVTIRGRDHVRNLATANLNVKVAMAAKFDTLKEAYDYETTVRRHFRPSRAARDIPGFKRESVASSRLDELLTFNSKLRFRPVSLT